MQIKLLIILFDFVVIIIRNVKISFIIIINIKIDKNNFFIKRKMKRKINNLINYFISFKLKFKILKFFF